MPQTQKLALIKDITQRLIVEDCDVSVAMKLVQSLADVLGDLSGVLLDEPGNTTSDTLTDSGLALSPMLAGKCITNTIRTQQFYRGIHHFLREVNLNKHEIDVLYGGCGPYAALMFPLLFLHPDIKINLTLIDIHEASINAAIKLFAAAEFKNVRLKAYTSDVTLWEPTPENTQYDLVLSETMNNALRKEPQVTIFKYLQQFLKPDGILIPQQISVSAGLFSSKEFVDLGPLFRLNKVSSEELFKSNKTIIQGQLPLPVEKKDVLSGLSISTEVHVYGDFYISPNATDFTTDINYRNVDFSELESLTFSYEMNSNPKFIFDLPFYQPPLPPADLDIKTRSGIPYLYVFWQNILWDAHKSRLNDKNKQFSTWIDWNNVLLLISSHSADLQLCIAQVLAEHPPEFGRFERWFLTEYGELDYTARANLNNQIASVHQC